jgi:hypothetical protein
MLGKFWEGIGGRLADRWAAVSVPALVFWLGGLLAWAYGAGGMDRLFGKSGWLDTQRVAAQIAVLVVALLAVAGSGVVVNRATGWVLRLLEGYWPRWLGPLRRRLVLRARTRAEAQGAAWQRLAQAVLAPTAAVPTVEQVTEFARLDQRRRRRPNRASLIMPTRIGNILRAAESWPADKYGLDGVVVWPRLWLVLQDSTRKELLAARAELDSAVGVVLWGVLFCSFAPWTLLVVPVGLGLAAAAVTVWVPARAEAFADLVESTYDVYRIDLYRQLRWPPPTNPSEERALGERLTTYLWRGSDDPSPTFTRADVGTDTAT